jgi:hypothetical protein
MAEAPLQRHRQPEEQPPDFRGGQIHIRPQRRDRPQQPADPVRFVAEQRRPPGRAPRQRRRECRGSRGPPRPLPPAGRCPSGQPPQAEVGPVHQPRDRPRLLGDQQSADQENEDARAGRQQEKQPGPHDEDAAADGEDFLVQPARPGLLPAREVRLEALAGRNRGELMPALVEGVEHGPGLRGVSDKDGGRARGARCSFSTERPPVC